MRNLIFLLISVGILSSCGVGKSLCPKPSIRDSVRVRDSVVIHDSTVIKVKTKDSIVVIEEVRGVDSLDATKDSKTTIRRGGDVFKVEVKEGKIYLSYFLQGTINKFNSVIEERDRQIKELKERESTQKTEILKVIEKEVIPWYVKYMIGYSVLITIGLIGKIILKGTFASFF